MEIRKKEIQLNSLKSTVSAQFTLDDDFNVPDREEDIHKIITSEGAIKITSTKVSAGHVTISGTLDFRLLYTGPGENPVTGSICGEIPFTENIGSEGMSETDSVFVSCELAALNISLINTRKLSIRSLACVSLSCEDVSKLTVIAPDEPDGETADLNGNSDNFRTCTEISGGSCKIFTLEKEIRAAIPVISKKDVCRIKGSTPIPSAHPCASKIIWESSTFRSLFKKILDDAISLDGEISVFILYSDDEGKLHWFDTSLPFALRPDMPGCSEDMTGDISVSVAGISAGIKADSDGERRIIETEIILELGIKIFNEERISYITDAYAPLHRVSAARCRLAYNTIRMKNLSLCRLSDRMKLAGGQPPLLQLAASFASAKPELISVCEEGLKVEGCVCAKLIYISQDDRCPLSVADEVLPFTHLIEAPGITEASVSFIRPSVDEINAAVVSPGEIEIAVTVALDTLVLDEHEDSVVTDLEISALSSPEIARIPSFTAYMVKSGDTLWDIAKNYESSMDEIKEINELGTENLPVGELILVPKAVPEIFE